MEVVVLRLMFKVSLFFCLLVFSGLTGAVTTAVAGQVNLFIYHRFGETRYPSTNISVDLFESHLKHLKQSGIVVTSLSDVVSRIKTGQKLPAKAAVLTVDDGFNSFLSDGMPLLRQYGFPVTLFVNTDSVGSRGYLSWIELRALVKEGVVIGNHSATHDYLIEQNPDETIEDWRERVKADITRAQAAFLKELNLIPTLFAYPYGEFSGELIDIVQKLGFEAAIAQQSGVVDDTSDLFAIPRFPMGGGYATLEQFRSKLSMSRLDAEMLEPVNTVPVNNPPQIKVRLDGVRFDLRRLQGFVQGDNSLEIEKVAGSDTDFLIQAQKPLTGRRNKYTLTAPLKAGGWGWFSQPWFLIR
jgi:peptidoglycan/xylan/chitin deacetylase (PgdA/CDA1 family)